MANYKPVRQAATVVDVMSKEKFKIVLSEWNPEVEILIQSKDIPKDIAKLVNEGTTEFFVEANKNAKDVEHLYIDWWDIED